MKPPSAKLLSWFEHHKRDLPWRRTRDPYRIWVSEIMLQQTRVEAVVPYYERFLERFPDVGALASAAEAEVLERWAGLGYYRRARQLQAAARVVVRDHAGELPADHAALLELPGIGSYTAGAVASIAFGLPHAALDGNIMRVLTRFGADARDISLGAARKALEAEAQRWIESAPEGSAGDCNQALMELGATVCTPRSPRCGACPLTVRCLGRRRGLQEQLPVKSRRDKQETLELAVVLVRRGGSLLMRRRPPQESIMPGFWELPEARGVRLDRDCFGMLGIRLGERLGEFKHAITFRSFRGRVWAGELSGPKPEEFRWVAARRRGELPLTTITKKALAAADSR